MTRKIGEIAGLLLAESQPIVDVSIWLQLYLTSNEGLGELDALDKAEEIHKPLMAYVTRTLEASGVRGVTPAFSYDEASGTLVRTVGLDDATSGSVGDRGRLTTIIRTMTADPFERVCEALLTLYGASRVSRLGKSGDGGIDLVALVDVPRQAAGTNRLRTVPIRVVAQAKGGSSSVAWDSVDAFGKRTSSVRSGGKLANQLPEWFRLRTEPVLGLFFSATALVPAARRAATESFVYTVDQDQIGEDLARSPSLDHWLTEGRVDDAKFRAYFATDTPEVTPRAITVDRQSRQYPDLSHRSQQWAAVSEGTEDNKEVLPGSET